MTLPALYAIADEYLADLAKLDDLDLPPEVVADTLESLGGELQEKCTSVAAYIRNMESLAAQIADAEKQMAQRRKALEHRAKAIREYLLFNMQRTGISKIDSPWFSIALRKSPPSVEILQGGTVPEEFMRQPEPPPAAPDKRAIADYLKANGDQLWARLVQSETVSIK